MSYHFGTEIAQFTLKVYQRGDEIETSDGRMSCAIDPNTLAVLDDNGNTDDWTEELPSLGTQLTGPFESHLKALKSFWVIELHCLPQGGLDYEQSEGDITGLMSEWAVEAAAIFKAGREPEPAQPTEPTTPLLDALDCFAIADTPCRNPGEIADSFYAVFHSSWSGGGGDSYMGDYDYEMELEFLGELAEIKTK